MPASLRAAEPTQVDFVDAATAAGLTCDEYQPSHFSCGVVTAERSWHSTIGGFGDELYLQVGRYLYGSTHQSVESDVLGLMKEYVRLLLDDDAEALAWLDRMNDGPQDSGEFQTEDRRLTWSTYGGEPSQIVLTLDYFPLPAASGPTDGPTAPAAPGTCLEADIIAAIGQIDSGEVDTDPTPAEVADALDNLDLDDREDGFRDTFVRTLRGQPDEFDPPLRIAAFAFQAEVLFTRCGLPTSSVVPSTSAGSGGGEPPAAAPVDPATGTGDDKEEPSFAASVPAPAEVSTDPIVLLQSAALAALLVFLMPFPSQLFNSTLETHEDEVRRWLRLDRIGSAVGKLGAFWASWPGVALFTLLAAVLYGFLDPGFGVSLGSLATFLGMLFGIVLVTAAFALPVVLAHRRLGDRWSLKVVPVSLLIGVACVLLSRLTGFQPGYLYGLLIGLAFARELSAADEGRATAIGAAVMLVVAFAAWLGLGALPDGDAFGLVVLRTSLAALMVAGLEGVVFGLLPMRFLPGEPLYAWNRILWGVLLAIGAFAFFHILINPASGYLSDSSRTPLFTVVALLVGFSLVSVAFWAWFRFRGSPPAEERTVT